MSIKKEVFEKAIHAALKARKIPKAKRIEIIDRDWFLIETNNAEADSIIEYEESLTRDFIKQSRVVVPTEHAEQVLVVKWFRANFKNVLIYANANGGYRAWNTAKQIKKEGSLSGVSDLTILWANGKTTWVEMKRKKCGVQSDDQKSFERFVTERGDTYLLCHGFDDAKTQIEAYYAANN